MNQQAVKSLLEPAVTPSPEVEQFFHDAAIRGSVDAVYGMGKIHQATDAKKAVGFFELAAKQGNTYAEYQLGKMHCFGEGVPQNLDVGAAWLQSAADHGNPHAPPATGGARLAPPSPNGGPISPDSVNNMLKRVLERACIPKVRFHDPRHTFATIALQNGVDIKTVSGMLGHFPAGFTLDTYAHVTTAAQREAAQTMENVLSIY